MEMVMMMEMGKSIIIVAITIVTIFFCLSYLQQPPQHRGHSYQLHRTMLAMVMVMVVVMEIVMVMEMVITHMLRHFQ